MSLSRRVHRLASWWPAAALALVAAVALSAAPEASAKRGITTGVAAPEYVSLDDSFRDLWFNRTVDANADLVRIDILWYRVVGAERPANPRDPADPAYDFSGIDAAVRSAAQRGLRVLFTVHKAPEWAEGPNRPDGLPRGVWRPDPREYGSFASAVATRYSGTFQDPGGSGTLPGVRDFEVWNEPNLDEHLAPQWDGKRAETPSIYRRLLNSFYRAVKAVDTRNRVVAPATAPFGDPAGEGRMRPVRFLRELFCLEGRKRLRPRSGCPKVRLDVLSHHPVALQNAPRESAINPDDAVTPDFNRVRRVLRAAERAGHVRPAGRRPIWATEFWWVSDPPIPRPHPYAVPELTHARYVQTALYLLWRQRIRVAIQYLIRDTTGDDLFKTGLFFVDGEPKLALRAFRFPFVTERLRGKRVRAWGRSPTRGRVVIQGRRGGGWKNLKRIRVRKGEVFVANVRGSKRMRARIGGEYSLVSRNRGGGGNR